MGKKWPCHPYSSIVGSEASTVFLYNLKEFHFESFTRATSDLIIITIREDKTSKIQKKLSMASDSDSDLDSDSDSVNSVDSNPNVPSQQKVTTGESNDTMAPHEDKTSNK